MKAKPDLPKKNEGLRRRAEARLKKSGGAAPAKPVELQRLIQELQVHQIELELQNEELQRAREEVEAGLERYYDLYELAPIGYLTLDRKGTLRQINLAGARLFGLERSRLTGKRLALRIAAAYLPVFDAFLRDLFTTTAKQTCEIELMSEDAQPLMLELTGVGVAVGLECRIVATDITECKRTEQERTRLQLQLAQAQKLEAIGTLAGGIAHDFNNLLAGISGGLSLLDLELGETGKPHAAILEMQSLVERGADLTKQLLALPGRAGTRPGL